MFVKFSSAVSKCNLQHKFNIIVLKCRVVASTALNVDRRRGSEDQLITTGVINDIMSSGGCAVKTA